MGTVESVQRQLDRKHVSELRDPDGLTAKQRKFLVLRERTFSDQRALDEAGYELVDLYDWRKESAFLKAYEDRAPKISLDDAKRELGQLFFETISIIRNAASGEEVTKSQRWAAERILKAFGLEKLTIESFHTTIPYEARLALEMARRGVALPPGFIDLMLSFFPQEYKALVEATPSTLPKTNEVRQGLSEETVEAEFRELPQQEVESVRVLSPSRKTLGHPLQAPAEAGPEPLPDE